MGDLLAVVHKRYNNRFSVDINPDSYQKLIKKAWLLGVLHWTAAVRSRDDIARVILMAIQPIDTNRDQYVGIFCAARCMADRDLPRIISGHVGVVVTDVQPFSGAGIISLL